MAEGVDRPGQRPRLRSQLSHGGVQEVGGEGQQQTWTPFSGFPSPSGPNPQSGFYGWDPLGQTPLRQTPLGQIPLGQTSLGQTPRGQTPLGQTPLGQTPLGQTPLSPSVLQQQEPFGLGGQGPFGHSQSPTSAFPPGRNLPSPSENPFHGHSLHFGHGVPGNFNSHSPLGASHHLVNSHFSSPSSPVERQPFSPVSQSHGDGVDFHYGLPSEGWLHGQDIPQEVPSTTHNVSFYPEYPYPPSFGTEISGSPASISPEPQDTFPSDFAQTPHSGSSVRLIPERQNSSSREALNSFPDGSPFSSIYTPFGMQDMHGNATTTTTPAATSTATTTTTPVPEDKAEITESASAKPSYSEVAKAMKGKPTHKSKEENAFTEGSPGAGGGGGLLRQKSLESNSKSGKSTSRRGGSHWKSRGQSLETNLEAPVQPDSKYGLDSFESVDGQVSGRVDEVLNGSMESLTDMGRKGSVSSVGSSAASGGEETARSVQAGRKTRDTAAREASRDQAGRQDSRPTAAGKTSAQKPSKQDKPFFDPKRIFQTKVSNRQSAGVEDVGGQSHQPREETSSAAQQVLNNGKPANPSKSAAAHKKPDYINNDLRDKRTNQTAAQNRGESGSSGSRKRGGRENHHQQNGATERGRREGGGKDAKREVASASGQRQRPEEEENARGVPLLDSIDWEAVEEWLHFLGEKMKSLAKTASNFIIMMALYLVGILMYLVSGGVHLLGLVWMKGLEEVKKRIFKGSYQEGTSGTKFPRMDMGRRRIGLEENIRLPVTGDEALHRLLACKGKDPYSILGLRNDTTEEDIKKYYRKQAVLVHPDKNQEPGAEEAFKILGHAFEMIGEPAKRKLYDSQMKVETEAEAAMQEFADLLTKLQEKMQEAANMMRCDNCGGKHKRVLVDRPWYNARYCDKCNCRHQAKEGDMWAETSMLGFLWHYYALMEGHVYDITDWVACRKDFFKHMQANAHGIYFRLATEGNRGRHHRANSGEPDIEDLINHLFQKTGMQPDGTWQPPAPPGGAGHPPSGGVPNKRTRRRKKKH